MGDPQPQDRPCSIERALGVIGDRWTMLVLRDAFRGLRRFDDFRRDLEIARPVLADRLRRLVEAGVLERRLYSERPPRYEYRLTPMGVDLSPSLIALMRWGDRWLSDDGAPTVLVHEACGSELDLHLHCPACDVTIRPPQIRSKPGPAAHPAPSTPEDT